MLTVIFLGTLLAQVAMPAPLFTGLRKTAMQEDVNILVYGVLQFSKSLHDLYDSTAQKLDRIWQSIGTHEQRLGVLHRQTQKAQKDQKEIREVVEGLKAKNTVLWQQTWSNKKMLQKMLVSHENLLQQVKGVEELMASMEKRGFPGNIQGFPALKLLRMQLGTLDCKFGVNEILQPVHDMLMAQMQQQNLTIWSLLGATHQQQQQMAQQKEQLLWIQEKINHHRDSKINVGDTKMPQEN